MCSTTYSVNSGIPHFLLEPDSGLQQAYDSIYEHHTDVWIDQGRSTDFQTYFGSLLAPLKCNRLLEVGCGEGSLLATLPAKERYGIDPSHHALLRATRRSGAKCAVARCEELPYPSASCDAVVAVGVMEHFSEPDLALKEIARVLIPGGHFITLIHTDMTRSQRVRLKLREYVFPPRPVALFRWISKKLGHPIVQPLRKSYTYDSARALLTRAGLSVTRTITRRTDRSAPLAGDHVLILVSAKS